MNALASTSGSSTIVNNLLRDNYADTGWRSVDTTISHWPPADARAHTCVGRPYRRIISRLQLIVN